MGANKDLELHPEEVKGKTDTYTSLTELYGVNIFTKEFEKIKEETNRGKEENRQEIEKQLFLDWNAENGIEEDELTSLLFGQQFEEILMESYEKDVQRINFGEAAMVGVSIAAVIAVYLLFSIDKKKR